RRAQRLSRTLPPRSSFAPFALAVAAAVSLAAENDDRVARLGESLAKSPAYKVRLQAAVLLGRSHDARAVPSLISALRDDHPTVRAAACLGLGIFADPSAITPLLDVVTTDDDPFVRDEAKAALGRFDHRILLAPVLAAAASSDVDLRHQAIDMLSTWP